MDKKSITEWVRKNALRSVVKHFEDDGAVRGKDNEHTEGAEYWYEEYQGGKKHYKGLWAIFIPLEKKVYKRR